MPHNKVGQILLKEGVITQEQLNNAIEKQKNKKQRLGDVLIDLGFITEEHLLFALGKQFDIPFLDNEKKDQLRPQKGLNLEKLLSGEFCRKNTVIPIDRSTNMITCAVNDPTDLLILDNIKRVSGCEIKIVLATKAAIQQEITNVYFPEEKDKSKGSMLNEAVERSYTQTNDDNDTIISPSKDSSNATELSLDNLIEKAGEAPVIKLVDLIIRQAIDERASDIHIEPFDNKIHLRYRIDGSLYNIPPPAPHLHLPIVSRIKILAKLDIAEKRLPQDGAITAKLEDRVVDIRISTVPTVWGEKVVMRILDKGAIPLELASLGFDQKQIDSIKKALLNPYGLFFVTGPTGSGKSTTLYASLNETIDPRKNVVTVEDPVEYKIEGVNQVSVKNEIGLSFAIALKAFLRQDPDVIMVGEVRDLETASICVRAALTGHFVLSTLHTNDAASAITRLIDIGVPNYLLTPSLVMILAQRLAKKLCPKCKEPYEPTKEQHGGIEFDSDLVYRAKGCDSCNHTGYKGRVVVSEVLLIDDEIRALISKSATHQELNDCARKNGMLTIFESGLKLVNKGITSFDEICRVSVEH
ncbi:MAG: Flp pilus assembly complex ATPase component TadA [Candidatus Omnitrophica bacterium]|nr:Flp pilus assembly complex ATPase component TadA [Candidatus Omnitrophota bacterium]